MTHKIFFYFDSQLSGDRHGVIGNIRSWLNDEMIENHITYKDLGGNPISDWKVVVNNYMLIDKNGDVIS